MKEASIHIRTYKTADARALADIYYHTIHQVNIRDYTETQVNAWAPETSLQLEGWQKKWQNLPPLVAVAGDIVIGFAEFEQSGHIDCFYVHHAWQGKGVGAALMQAIFNKAVQQGISRIYAEVSITAKPFFERKGFQVVKAQTVTIRGEALNNFMMEKILEQ